MKSFKDLKIKPVDRGLVGDKIEIKRVLDKEIIVTKFQIKESKYAENRGDKCLHLQIKHEGYDRVIFTGSVILIEMIEQVEKSDFPFKTTIVKVNDRLMFT